MLPHLPTLPSRFYLFLIYIQSSLPPRPPPAPHLISSSPSPVPSPSPSHLYPPSLFISSGSSSQHLIDISTHSDAHTHSFRLSSSPPRHPSVLHIFPHPPLFFVFCLLFFFFVFFLFSFSCFLFSFFLSFFFLLISYFLFLLHLLLLILAYLLPLSSSPSHFLYIPHLVPSLCHFYPLGMPLLVTSHGPSSPPTVGRCLAVL